MISIPHNAPSTTGVYIFLRRNTPIYIGKAVNLKKRLASYWRKNSGPKIHALLKETTAIRIIETESEIDALIKEAELIKKYYPKYNIVMRDDKNYFYVAVTKADFPRIYITHQPFASAQIEKLKISAEGGSASGGKNQNYNLKSKINYLGPFTSGTALKIILRILRNIFPYCTCKEKHKRPCLNSEIGRCMGYCCLKNVKLKAENEKQTEYKKNIKSIVAVLSGRKKKLLYELKIKMREASIKQEYERAAQLRDEIMGIENIFAHQYALEVGLPMGSPTSPKFYWPKIEKNIRQLLGIKKRVSRIEGYDISNISGASATGSMVVFTDGKPEKSEYRKFSIKTVYGANDVKMHQEVMRRRLRHTEWPMPDVILIDGGKPQLNAILSLLRNEFPNLNVFITALAKREEELYTKNITLPIPLRDLPSETGFFFQRVRDESHRFAKKYHHKLRELAYRESR